VYKNPIEGIGIVSLDNDIKKYVVNIMLMSGPYKDYCLQLLLTFPDTYPINPPKILIYPGQIFDNLYHRHIFIDENNKDEDGKCFKKLCLDLLDNDFMSTKTENTGWNPSYTISSLLMQVQIFLANPDMSETSMPKAYQIKELMESMNNYQRKFSLKDENENKEIIKTHTWKDPYPKMFFKEKEISNDTNNQISEEKNKLIKENLTCFISKKNIFDDPNIILGYPIVKETSDEIYPIPEILSYEGYLAQIYNENSYNYVPNYYFDPNTKLFKRCHEACLLCRQQIDVNENDTQCYQCNNGYGYYILNGSDQSDPDNKKCYHQSREGYYLNTDDNKIHKCPDKCTKCEYTHLYQQVNNDAFCTECNNELGFYQIEFYGGGLEYLRHSTYDSRYMECYTWRIEKLKSDTHYNHQPPDDTLFIGNVFKKCNPACAKCTSIGTSVYDTRCQAKQCKPNYIYVQNNEDICFDSRLLFPLHFKYNDPVLGETYFKPCYLTCKTCSADGTKSINNCIECREGYIMHPNQITNAHNCVFDCLTLANNNYYYLDEDNNDEYICVEKCPDKYPFLLPEKKRCLKTCETEPVLKYSKDRICVSPCPDGTIDNIKKECVSISNECVKSDLESNLILADVNDTNINKLIIDYCQDYSYTSNQINKITNKLNEFNIILYKNKKCVEGFYGDDINFPDLSVCFNDLKNYYELSLNQDLIVMIMNILRNDSYIRVEYKVFNSLTCEELQLGNCSIKNIFTEIKMERYFREDEILKSKDMYLNKDINVYDRDHPFFTDICYQYTYKGDQDMILEDRVNMYYQDISNICEKKCEPKADFDKRIIKCGCQLKEQFLLEENNEDEKKWNFGVSGISIEVFKCSGKSFMWKYFKENIGSYTALVLIVAEIPVVIYYIVVGLSKVKLFLIPFMGVNPPKRKSINNYSQNENSSNILSFNINFNYSYKKYMYSRRKLP